MTTPKMNIYLNLIQLYLRIFKLSVSFTFILLIYSQTFANEYRFYGFQHSPLAVGSKINLSFEAKAQDTVINNPLGQSSISWSQLLSSAQIKNKLDTHGFGELQSFNQNDQAFSVFTQMNKSIQSIRFKYAYGVTTKWSFIFSSPLFIQKTILNFNKSYSDDYLKLKKKYDITESDEYFLFSDLVNYNSFSQEQKQIYVPFVQLKSLNQVYKNRKSNLFFVSSLSFPFSPPESKYDIFYDPNNEPTLNYEMGIHLDIALKNNYFVNSLARTKLHFNNQINTPKIYSNTSQKSQIIQKKSPEQNFQLSLSKKQNSMYYFLGARAEVQGTTKYKNTTEVFFKKNEEISQKNNQFLFSGFDYLLDKRRQTQLGLEYEKKIKALHSSPLEESIRINVSYLF